MESCPAILHNSGLLVTLAAIFARPARCFDELCLYGAIESEAVADVAKRELPALHTDNAMKQDTTEASLALRSPGGFA